ncbi:MAG: hypothetical protein IJU44_03255 [Kiritimatiellae bacterium]|nr:hypothetical protein [Kiritimatiellia bacterium]
MNGKCFAVVVALAADIAMAEVWPVGYTRVAGLYVSNGAYINTDFKPNQNTTTVMDVEVDETKEYWFGAWNVAYNNGAYCMGNDGGNVYNGYGNQGGGGGSPIPNGRHTVSVDRRFVLADEETRRTFSANTFQLEYPLFLFGQNRKGTPAFNGNDILCYSCQIYDNGEKVRDFIPCYRNGDNVAGLMDVVNGTFYQRQGGGSVMAIVGNAKGDASYSYANGQLTVNTVAGDCELTAREILGVTALTKQGEGTLWVLDDNGSAANLACDSATLAAGGVGFNVVSEDEYSRISAIGTVYVNGTVTVRLPEMMPAGTYTFISANALNIADGAGFVLDSDCIYGAGTSVRTLSVSANAVTVTVSGDPLAFPDGYTAVPYLQGTGTQYIDTGFIHTADTKVEAVVNISTMQNGATGWAAVFGSRRNAYTQNGYIFFSHRDSFSLKPSFNRTGNETNGEGFPYDQKVTLNSFGRVIAWSAEDGTEGGITTDGTPDKGANSMYIFDLNRYNGYGGHTPDNSRATMKLYAFRIWDGARLVRDFVPCRNLNGELGVYDRVMRIFHANLGTDRFYTENESAAFVKYIESSGGSNGQYIDTHYIHQADTKVTLVAEIPYVQPAGWSGVFGARVGSVKTGAMVFFSKYRTAGNISYSRTGDKDTEGAATDMVYDERATWTFEGVNASWVGDSGATGSFVAEGTADAGGNNMILFGFNNGAAGAVSVDASRAAMKLYSCKIEDGGVVRRDFVPYRNAEGAFGLYDTIEGVFYPNQAKGSFACTGMVYTVSGTALTVYEGTLVDEDLTGYTSLTKVSPNATYAYGLTVPIPTLTISEGMFSVQDGAANQYTVNGALTLASGARLAIDLTASTNDIINATSIDLSGVAADNPVLLSVSGTGVAMLEEGESRVIITGSGLTDADADKFTVVGLPVQVQVQDGNLTLVPKAASMLEWLGAGDIIGKWSNAGNWVGGLLPETGDMVLFNLPAGGTTRADLTEVNLSVVAIGADAGEFVHNGTETLTVLSAITNLSASTVQTFNMPMELGVDGLPFYAYSDGALKILGAVNMNAQQFVKDGAGEIEIAGTAFAAPEIVISGGKVKLAEDSSVALTPEQATGTITIAEGGQLDFNYPGTISYNSAARNSYTSGKIVHIAGSGPDGTGALVNNVNSTQWFSSLTRLVLDGDATVGGSGRIDMRNGWGDNLYKGRTSVYGPDYTLTSLVTHLNGFNFNSSDVELKKIVVGEGGHINFEGEVNLEIANGIELKNDSHLDLWSATVNGEVSVSVGSGVTANINQIYGTSVLDLGLNVETDATLNLIGGNSVRVGGELNNNGDIVITGTGRLEINSPVSGTGTISVPTGSLSICPDFVNSADSQVSYNVGGSLYFGHYIADENNGIPEHPPVFDTMTADVAFLYGANSTISGHAYDAVVAQANDAGKSVGVYGSNADLTLTLTDSDWTIGELRVGSHQNPAHFTIGDGATVTVSSLFELGRGGNNALQSILQIDDGGVLEFTGTDAGSFRIGEWSPTAANTHRHDIIVDGGTFVATNITAVSVGYDSPYAELALNSGIIRANGIKSRYRTNYVKADYPWQARYVQKGGTLELGAQGFTSSINGYNGDYNLNLQSGVLKVVDSFSTSPGYLTSMFGVEAGDPSAPNVYEIDLNGNSVAWNTALLGMSDVVIKGSGTFSSTAETQGVPTGLWTVQSDVSANLAGASGFAGGLKADEDAAVTIDISSESTVEFGVFSMINFPNFASMTNYTGAYQYQVDSLDQLHGVFLGSPPLGNNFYMAYRGQFYVPEDQGDRQWYFGGCFDDILYFEIDGENIGNINNVNVWNTIRVGNKYLTAGWHNFRVIFGNTAGGWRADMDGWKNYMALGWSVDPSSAGQTSVASYQKFDTSTLKMRLPETTVGKPASSGLGGVTSLASGSLLYNLATTACPIYGVLEGAGSLRGQYKFTESGVWRINCSDTAGFDVVKVSELTNPAEFTASIRNIEMAISGAASRAYYPICAANGLTAADARENIAVTATGDEAKPGWYATVKGGTLMVVNPNPPGTLMMVR